MKFPRSIRSSVLRSSAAICLATASVCAQSQPPLLLLELKRCGRVQVFEDGTVVESRDDKKTERRLSADRMRKLREIIEHGPCEEQWRQPPREYTDDKLRAELLKIPKLDTSKLVTSNSDCVGAWKGVLIGVDEVVVTRGYPDHQVGPFPVYVLCETAKEYHKKRARQEVKNSRWPRFFSDVESVLGGESIHKRCKCGLNS